MKKHLDARVCIVFISLLLIMSILAFVFINGNVAWLSKNDEVMGQGMSISADNSIKMTAALIATR